MGEAFRPDFARLLTTAVQTGATTLILVPELLRGLIAAQSAMRLDHMMLSGRVLLLHVKIRYVIL